MSAVSSGRTNSAHFSIDLIDLKSETLLIILRINNK